MITTQSFTILVQNMVTAIQGRASRLVDVTVGSILRALSEAFAAQLMWQQALAMQILATTRASSSNGADLDSWMADYGLERLLAVATTGPATFGRFTYTEPAYITPTATLNANGTVNGTAAVESADGTQLYGILTVTGNAYWNAGLGQYVIPASTPGINIPIVAMTPGAAGNAGAGVINTLASALPGIDTVSNGSTFANGMDAESDTAFRARFQLYLASLEKATMTAVIEAIQSVKNGTTCNVVEGLDYATNTARAGYFYGVVDDGSGAPGSGFLTSVYNAVDVVRPLGTVFEIHGPNLVTADIAMTVELAAGYDGPTEQAAIEAALNAYVSALGLGKGLPYTRLPQIAYDASAGVLNVTGVSLNSGISDIAPVAKNSIKPGTISVSIA